MTNKHIDIIKFTKNCKESFKKPHDWFYFLGFISHKFKRYQTRAITLLGINTPFELSFILKSSVLLIEDLVNYPDYTSFLLRKKRGGYRVIQDPEKNLKTLQKRLNNYLQAYYLCIKPPFVHGFVLNPKYFENSANIVENARHHIGKRHLLNIDLKDFFQEISASQIKRLFVSEYFQFNDHIASILALLVTYQGRLPVGAPTSPVVSNFVCLWLDSFLFEFCQKKNITYSRYADDLSFSSDFAFDNKTINEIYNIVEGHGFYINQKKTRLSGANRKQTVTGLVVNQKVNIDRRFIRKTRAMIHDWSKHGLVLASLSHFGIPEKGQEDILKLRFTKILEGRINFIGQVRGRDDGMYLKLEKHFRFALNLEKTKLTLEN